MPYVRLSIAHPQRGQEQRLEELMRKLNELSREQEGLVDCYVLRPSDNSSEIARIAIYRDEAVAERHANSQSFMAIRSEIHLISEADHVERAFVTI